MGAHWRHLANTIKWFVPGGDAALRYTILTTCYQVSYAACTEGDIAGPSVKKSCG